MTNSIQFNVILEKHEDLIIVICQEFDLSSEGSSIEEAKISLVEALKLIYQATSKEDILKQCLVLHNLGKIKIAQKPAHDSMKKYVRHDVISVPISNKILTIGKLRALVRTVLK